MALRGEYLWPVAICRLVEAEKRESMAMNHTIDDKSVDEGLSHEDSEKSSLIKHNLASFLVPS
jgi:hypothetical protein